MVRKDLRLIPETSQSLNGRYLLRKSLIGELKSRDYLRLKGSIASLGLVLPLLNDSGAIPEGHRLILS